MTAQERVAAMMEQQRRRTKTTRTLTDTGRATYLAEIASVKRTHDTLVERDRTMAKTVEAWESQTMRLRATLRESVAARHQLEQQLRVVSQELQRLKQELFRLQSRQSQQS